MPTNTPLVSVIIPSYNYAAYLPDALNSILRQTYLNWEVIVVDDGSKDDTAAVVQQYISQDARIRYQYQRNAGLSAARNTGIRLAKGEYIQLLDADDYIASTKLELQVQTLNEQPDVALVFGDTFLFQHSTSREEHQYRPFHLQKAPMSGQGTSLALYMAYDNIFLVGTPLLRKELVNRIGKYNEQLLSLEDWHFWFRGVLTGARYVYDNQIGTEFYVRTHGNNMSGNRYRMWKNKIYARQLIIEQMQTMLKTSIATSLDLKSVLAKHIALLYEEQARFQLLYGSVGQGVANTVRYSLQGEKPIRIWYDSAYWLKERLLGRNKTGA